MKRTIALNPNLAHNKNQVTTAHHRLAQSLLRTGQSEAGQKELEIASDLKAQAFKLEQQTQTGAPGMGAGRLSDSDKELPGLAPEDHNISQANNLDFRIKQELQNSEAYYREGRWHCSQQCRTAAR